MAPSFRQKVFIRGAVWGAKWFNSNETIRMTMLHDAIKWEAKSRNAEPLINANVDSEARNHADNCMLRPKRVYFWIHCRFNANIFHELRN